MTVKPGERKVTSMEEAEQFVRKMFRSAPQLEVTSNDTQEYVRELFDVELSVSTCRRILLSLKRRGLLERAKCCNEFVYGIPQGPGL